MQRNLTEFLIGNRKVRLSKMPETKEECLNIAKALENDNDKIAEVLFEQNEDMDFRGCVVDEYIRYFKKTAQTLSIPSPSHPAPVAPTISYTPALLEDKSMKFDTKTMPTAAEEDAKHYDFHLKRKIEILILQGKLPHHAMDEYKSIPLDVMFLIREIAQLKTDILKERNAEATKLRTETEKAISPTDVKSHTGNKGSLHELRKSRSSTTDLFKQMVSKEQEYKTKNKCLEEQLEKALKKHAEKRFPIAWKKASPKHLGKITRSRSLNQIIAATSPRHFKKSHLADIPQKNDKAPTFGNV